MIDGTERMNYVKFEDGRKFVTPEGSEWVKFRAMMEEKEGGEKVRIAVIGSNNKGEVWEESRPDIVRACGLKPQLTDGTIQGG